MFFFLRADHHCSYIYFSTLLPLKSITVLFFSASLYYTCMPTTIVIADKKLFSHSFYRYQSIFRRTVHIIIHINYHYTGSSNVKLHLYCPFAYYFEWMSGIFTSHLCIVWSSETLSNIIVANWISASPYCINYNSRALLTLHHIHHLHHSYHLLYLHQIVVLSNN